LAKIGLALLGLGRVGRALVGLLARRPLEGLWHDTVGGYRLEDIELRAVYDVDPEKVGRPLSELVPGYQGELRVERGVLLERLPFLEAPVTPRPDEEAFAGRLRASGAHMALNLITSGAPESARFYCLSSLRAGLSFINAAPVRLAADPQLAGEFGRRGLIIAGDDLLSQLGATALHRALIWLLAKRGLRVLRSYELDVGGGMDARASLLDEVKEAKRSIIRESLRRELPYPFQTAAGTVEYVEFLGERRVSYIYLEGEAPLGTVFRIDVTLKSEDPANAVNVLVDVIRAVARAKEMGERGAVPEICAYGFKLPPEGPSLLEAQERFEAKYCP